MKRRRVVAATIALTCAVTCACVRKKDPPWVSPPADAARGEPTLQGEPARIKRATAAPVIDGKLDDAAWGSATALGPLVKPGDGAEDHASPVDGFARMTWDDAKLYIAFVVKDGAAGSPFGRDDVDPHLWEKSSAVELMIQPGDPGDNKGYYEIQIDVAGAVFDTRWDDYNTPIADGPDGKRFGHMDWSCKAERAVSRGDGRYYAVEIALPWSAFAGGRAASPPKAGDVWRVNLYTFRDGQRHALAWSPIRRQGNFHKASRFGRVRFE
ncbi:MAG: carbohydrate-binding family 9-like protein [Myxococcales bacterium]|nr:carbohydrate-binding family 9-like protein [Myxococcales bacterium]